MVCLCTATDVTATYELDGQGNVPLDHHVCDIIGSWQQYVAHEDKVQFYTKLL